MKNNIEDKFYNSKQSFMQTPDLQEVDHSLKLLEKYYSELGIKFICANYGTIKYKEIMKNKNNIEDKFYNAIPLPLDFRQTIIMCLKNAEKKQIYIDNFIKRIGELKEEAKYGKDLESLAITHSKLSIEKGNFKNKMIEWEI